MRIHRSVLSCSAALSLLSGASVASDAPCEPSPTVFAVGQFGFDSELLIVINGATGEVISQTQLTGIVDTNMPRALEFTPQGRLLAFTQLTDNRLYEIDPSSAVATEIGQFNAPLFEGGLAIVDEATAYVSNVNTSSVNFLGLVDITDATFDRDIRLSHDTINLDLSGLALRDDGMLVGFDSFGREVPERLVVVDPDSGEVAALTDIMTPLNGDTAGMTIHNGVGYFIYNRQEMNPLIDSRLPELWSFDPYTGEQTFIAQVPTDYQINGIAIAPCQAPLCDADLAAPFGVLDLSDIDVFIDAFITGGPSADLTAPIGTIDLSDIDAFIALFASGCP